MRTLVEQLSQYAAYHRDARNIATHFIGIPMIVIAVTVLLARPLVLIAGFGVSPASLAVLVAAGYYLLLGLRDEVRVEIEARVGPVRRAAVAA